MPLPLAHDQLKKSSDLGAQIADLLDSSAGRKTKASHLMLGTVSTLAPDGAIRPERGDLGLRAGWGYQVKGGVTPGSGKVSRRSPTPEELEGVATAGAQLHLTKIQSMEALGSDTFDVFANEFLYWRHVPARVWEFTIGGYQVLKKWLSYREEEITRRHLTKEEAREFSNVATRIGALLLMQNALDDNYVASAKSAYVWNRDDEQEPDTKRTSELD